MNEVEKCIRLNQLDTALFVLTGTTGIIFSLGLTIFEKTIAIIFLFPLLIVTFLMPLVEYLLELKNDSNVIFRERLMRHLRGRAYFIIGFIFWSIAIVFAVLSDLGHWQIRFYVGEILIFFASSVWWLKINVKSTFRSFGVNPKNLVRWDNLLLEIGSVLILLAGSICGFILFSFLPPLAELDYISKFFVFLIDGIAIIILSIGSTKVMSKLKEKYRDNCQKEISEFEGR